MPNHCVVHLKTIVTFCVNYTQIKKKNLRHKEAFSPRREIKICYCTYKKLINLNNEENANLDHNDIPLNTGKNKILDNIEWQKFSSILLVRG